MEDWIRDLVSGLTGTVRSLAQGAADRIASVYNAFTSALGRIRAGFGTWVSRGVAWASGSIRFALAVAAYLRWLVLSLLPAHIAAAVDAVSRWATQRLMELQTWTLGNLVALRDWAVARLTEFIAWLTQLRDWIVARVDEIRADLARLLDRVFNILGTPERAARWLVAALVPILLGFLADHAAEIGASLWSRRDLLLDQALDQADELVDRIF